MLLLAPICPHYAEAAWRGPLGHKDGPSVTRAPFPVAGPIDATLVAQDAYLQAKLHAFRVAITKVGGRGHLGACALCPPSHACFHYPLQATYGKPGKAKAAAAVPPTHARIYVATEFAPWQRFVLERLASLYDPSPEGVAARSAAHASAVAAKAPVPASIPPFCFPTDALAQLQARALRKGGGGGHVQPIRCDYPPLQAAVKDSPDATLKPLTKRIMEFASVTMSEQVGGPASLPL